MKTIRKLTTRAAKWLLLLGLALSTTACLVQSLHPLSTEKDVVFEPALVGTWVGMGKAEGDKSTIIFQKAEGQTYKVIYHPKDPKEGEPREFEGHMVRLGKFLFLDTFPAPADAPTTNNLMYAIHILETHQIFRIQLDGDVLRVSMLEPKKFDKAKIRHEAFGKPQAFLLTAPTNELQEFVLKHAEDAFTDVGEWHRQKEGDIR